MNEAIVVLDVGVRYDLRLSRQRTFRSTLGQLARRRAAAETTREFWALRDVTFSLEKGDVLGVVGLNGSGKSTLMLTIAGVLLPDAGAVSTFGARTTLLTLGAGFEPNLTGRDNIYLNGAYLGFTRRKIEARLDEIIDFSELGDFIDAPVRKYSTGMRARLAFSIAAHVEPEILILDEVLGAGDVSFQEKSKAKTAELMACSRAIIVVSHSPSFITDTCTKALWLHEGHLAAFGDPPEVLERYLKAARSMAGPVRAVA